GAKGLSRAYILRAAEASLRRLRTDVIDLYQAHTDDEATPHEETLGAFAALIRQGKVRAVGASNPPHSLTSDRRGDEEHGGRDNVPGAARLPCMHCAGRRYPLSTPVRPADAPHTPHTDGD